MYCLCGEQNKSSISMKSRNWFDPPVGEFQTVFVKVTWHSRQERIKMIRLSNSAPDPLVSRNPCIPNFYFEFSFCFDGIIFFFAINNSFSLIYYGILKIIILLHMVPQKVFKDKCSWNLHAWWPGWIRHVPSSLSWLWS